MWQNNLMVEEVSGRGASLGNVGEHVHHVLVDAGPVWAAVDPLTALCKCREVERFDGAVPAEVDQFRVVVELIIQWNILGQVIGSRKV